MQRSVRGALFSCLGSPSRCAPRGRIAQEGAPTDAPATPTPSGNRVDIGGRALFLSCRGTGSPTVVLEAGSGNAADTWVSVQPEVARSPASAATTGPGWPERPRPNGSANRPGQR